MFLLNKKYPKQFWSLQVFFLAQETNNVRLWDAFFIPANGKKKTPFIIHRYQLLQQLKTTNFNHLLFT